ncbi:MAG TPA: Holliday junction resolvase RuvX [Clostridia bacterium]|nr:Holliday junction resolvase RuvX [Clostridia bacterium]
MRIMGLDVGDKTIGVAVSDPLGLTAQGITTIKRSELAEDLRQVARLVEQYGVELVVLGLPKNMDGTIGPQGEKVLAFRDTLERELKIPTVLQDERWSTLEAERLLIRADLSRSKRKKVIDKMAASVILQGYLDARFRNPSQD